jgi:hypothetical protein
LPPCAGGDSGTPVADGSDEPARLGAGCPEPPGPGDIVDPVTLVPAGLGVGAAEPQADATSAQASTRVNVRNPMTERDSPA